MISRTCPPSIWRLFSRARFRNSRKLATPAFSFTGISTEMTQAYEVALSFAGEDRNYARELADDLARRGVRVFFDEFEKDRLWGEDLYTYLTDIYQNGTRYVVMLISKFYPEKLWTNLERKAAQAKALQQQTPYILPIRLDDTPIPGVLL